MACFECHLGEVTGNDLLLPLNRSRTPTSLVSVDHALVATLNLPLKPDRDATWRGDELLGLLRVVRDQLNDIKRSATEALRRRPDVHQVDPNLESFIDRSLKTDSHYQTLWGVRILIDQAIQGEGTLVYRRF